MGAASRVQSCPQVIVKETLKEKLELAGTRGVQREHNTCVAPGNGPVWRVGGLGKERAWQKLDPWAWRTTVRSLYLF